MNLMLIMALLSDTTLGRGDGVAGLVDQEVEHDSQTGLPIIRGRTIKGLLVEECANILYSLENHPQIEAWNDAAKWLFGSGGSTLTDGAHLHVGTGELPDDLINYVRQQVLKGSYTPTDILGSLTTIRRQTSLNEETGAPDDHSLRGSRVVTRGVVFNARLDFDGDPQSRHVALLTACAITVRRAGSGRNRGRGHVDVRIEGKGFDIAQHLKAFEALVRDQA